MPENIIISAVLSEGGDSANRFQHVLAPGHPWPQCESHALDHVRDENSRGHLDRHAQRLQPGPRAASRDSPIQTSNDAVAGIQQRSHDLTQAVSPHTNIAVCYHQVGSLGAREHLLQGEYLRVGIGRLARQYNRALDLWIFSSKDVNHVQCWIARVTCGEYNFEVGIVLQEKTF